MSKKIVIEECDNGYIIVTEGSIKCNGRKVFENTKEFKLIEEIGLALLDKKIKVELV